MNESASNYFIAENNIAIPAVTADQMREIDRIAVEKTGPNLYQMMENAGRNVAELTLELLGSRWPKADIMVLAGSGGNGGGGICAARHLANHHARVTLCLSNPEKLSSVPAFQYKIYKLTAGREISVTQIEQFHADFIIDALVGYSLR